MAGYTVVPSNRKKGRDYIISHNAMSSARRLLALCGVLAFSSFSSPGQPLHFARERISIVVENHQVQVTGDYHFRNPGRKPIQATVLYPFPIRSDQPFPDSIMVTDVLAREQTAFGKSDSALSFAVRIPPLSTRIYRVSFRQKTFAYRFEYILNTTRWWPAPVGLAEFFITLARDLSLQGISIPAEENVREDGSKIYHIRKTNFQTDQNLVVRWERRRP